MHTVIAGTYFRLGLAYIRQVSPDIPAIGLAVGVGSVSVNCHDDLLKTATSLYIFLICQLGSIDEASIS